MKKLLLTFMLIGSTSLVAQMKTGDFIISMDGNYIKNSSSFGVTQNAFTTSNNQLTLSPSISIFANKSLFMGIGADLIWQKNDNTNTLLLSDYLQMEKMNIKSRAIVPYLFAGYYIPLIKNLYFNGNLKVGYGNLHTDTKSNLAGMTVGTSSSSYPTASESRFQNDTPFLGTALNPELVYFFSDKLGLSLGLGSIEYDMYDWKTENSSVLVNFNPTYWRVGFKIKFPKVN